MLTALLGIDTGVLQECSLKEQSGYRLAGWAFAAVCVSMVAADAYFGYLFHGSWWAVLLAGNFLGYIHFAVYRLAMITLTTRPLGEVSEARPAGLVSGIRAWMRPDAAALFRLVFVSLIALAVSFPGAALFFHQKAEAIQLAQREMLQAEAGIGGIGSVLIEPSARFPFEVFRQLLHLPGYKLLLLLWMGWVFFPMLLLARLRHGSGMQYTRSIAALHREITERNFYANLLEAQEELNARFPGKVQLQEQLIYEDPPFNTIFRNRKNRQFGSDLIGSIDLLAILE